ncbi:MAG: TetR/AcrR family transcriptional regulator [Pseudomonadota bacterium]
MTQDTRTQLLDIAEHAARARGFDGFSYADMARAVGIRKASIHYHFPTKSDLSVALIVRYHTRMATACADIDAGHPTGSGKLRALIAHYRAALNGGDTLCLCVALTISRDTLPADVVTHLHAFRAMMTNWLINTFETGTRDESISDTRDAQRAAHATLALMEGAHLAARAACDVAQFDEATAVLQAHCR